MPSDGQEPGAHDAVYPGYCDAHAAAAPKYGWPFIPFSFPGCAACSKPDVFDISTQYHLAASAEKK